MSCVFGRLRIVRRIYRSIQIQGLERARRISPNVVVGSCFLQWGTVKETEKD